MEEQKGKAATRAKNKYNAQNYDSLRIVVPKGRKEELQTHAAAKGESLNGFVNRAIDEAVERDNDNLPQNEGLTARVYKAGPEGMIDTEERI